MKIYYKTLQKYFCTPSMVCLDINPSLQLFYLKKYSCVEQSIATTDALVVLQAVFF